MINLSVHVRGGDACDVVEHSTLNGSLLWGQWDGKRDKFNNPLKFVRRHCVHPRVHLRVVQQLLAYLHSKSVAVDVFVQTPTSTCGSRHTARRA